jgi:hypothetical protein
VAKAKVVVKAKVVDEAASHFFGSLPNIYIIKEEGRSFDRPFYFFFFSFGRTDLSTLGGSVSELATAQATAAPWSSFFHRFKISR